MSTKMFKWARSDSEARPGPALCRGAPRTSNVRCKSHCQCVPAPMSGRPSVSSRPVCQEGPGWMVASSPACPAGQKCPGTPSSLQPRGDSDVFPQPSGRPKASRSTCPSRHPSASAPAPPLPACKAPLPGPDEQGPRCHADRSGTPAHAARHRAETPFGGRNLNLTGIRVIRVSKPIRVLKGLVPRTSPASPQPTRAATAGLQIAGRGPPHHVSPAAAPPCPNHPL
jgi:hypothetical protein